MKNIQQIIEEQQANLQSLTAKEDNKQKDTELRVWMLELASGLLKFLREETLKSEVTNQKDYAVQLKRLEDSIRAIPKTEKVSVKNLESVIRGLDDLKKAISGIKFPEIPQTIIPDNKKELLAIERAVKDIKVPDVKIPAFPKIPEVDFSVLVKELKRLEKSLVDSMPTFDEKTQRESFGELEKIEKTLNKLKESLDIVADKEYPTPTDRTDDILLSLKDVSQTINDIKFPVPIFNTTPVVNAIEHLEGILSGEINVDVDTSGLATEATLQDLLSASGGSSYSIYAGPEEDTGYLYIGYEDRDGGWYIKRKNLTTNIWTYCTGGSSIPWATKTSQTYGTYSATF